MRKAVLKLTVVVLLGCWPLAASARPPQALKSLHPEFSDQIFEISLDGVYMEKDELRYIEAYPGSVLEISLMGGGEESDLFFDQNNMPMNTVDVTASRLRAANASVFVETNEGGIALRSAELTIKRGDGSKARPVIAISFAKSFSGLDRVDFSFDASLMLGGEEQAQSVITVSGTFGNTEMAVFPESEAVTPDGAVMVAEDDIDMIEIDAGYEIYVTASMKEGGRYRAVAAPSSGRADLDALSLDSRLVDIIVIDSGGFDQGEVKTVLIKTGEPLFAYDEDGRFVGMTESPLPPRTKYTLAVRKIED